MCIAATCSRTPKAVASSGEHYQQLLEKMSADITAEFQQLLGAKLAEWGEKLQAAQKPAAPTAAAPPKPLRANYALDTAGT